MKNHYRVIVHSLPPAGIGGFKLLHFSSWPNERVITSDLTEAQKLFDDERDCIRAFGEDVLRSVGATLVLEEKKAGLLKKWKVLYIEDFELL